MWTRLTLHFSSIKNWWQNIQSSSQAPDLLLSPLIDLLFRELFGIDSEKVVDINTVDGFQVGLLYCCCFAYSLKKLLLLLPYSLKLLLLRLRPLINSTATRMLL